MPSYTPSHPKFKLHRSSSKVKIWLQPDINWPDYDPLWSWDNVDEYWSAAVDYSEGHWGWQALNTTNDIGGDFRVWTREFSEYSSLGTGSMDFSEYGIGDPFALGLTHHFLTPRAEKGTVTNTNFFYPWEYTTPSSQSTLDSEGTTAISRVLPTNPMFNLAAFLGELREGLPRFGLATWKDRASRARGAGSDYLNYQFGWLPLISDIRSFAHMVKNANRVLDQYEKDSGKPIRRRYDWDAEWTPYSWEGTGYDPANLWESGLIDRSKHIGRRRIDGRIERRKYLEAVFTYYLPPRGTIERDLAMANKLLGWRITPEVLWELTPWSWAADWVTNIGDIAKNVSAFMSDGLVMPYAYVMEEVSLSVTYQLDKVAFKSYPGMTTLRQTFKESVKTRRRATPFGFGFDWSGLTPRQGAILAALGISRRK